ncbi:MAG: sulfite exporter TauE/SafE family protein, partial [Eudoraea sp.]|nr:sulfite exporter TauE/SafE family protein [Eudoraea sp.]
MEFTDFFGYIAALAIGIVMGLVGGGGSILAVPVLVYLLGLNPIISTAYSLFIVGVTALIGALKNIRKGLVDFRTAIVFATPAFITVYITRK